MHMMVHPKLVALRLGKRPSIWFEGLANKEIAVRIGVSESSVKATLQQLFSKTGVRTRSQLVRIVFEQHRDQLSVTQAAGGSGMAHRELRRSILPLFLLTTVVLAATGYGNGSAPPPRSSSEGQQIGQILSVRKVLENRYFVGRYPQIHYYLLYFAVRTSHQTYCAEYETPVLDEIDDLVSAKDKDVDVVLKGKSLTLRTPKARKFKAKIVVEQKQC